MEVGVLGDEGGGEAEEQAEADGAPEDAEEVGEGVGEVAAGADGARLEGLEEHDGHGVVEHALPCSPPPPPHARGRERAASVARLGCRGEAAAAPKGRCAPRGSRIGSECVLGVVERGGGAPKTRL